MSTFTQLVERLGFDPYLRYVCGFEPFGAAPSNSCFSRLYPKLAKSGCLETLFSTLVKQAEEIFELCKSHNYLRLWLEYSDGV